MRFHLDALTVPRAPALCRAVMWASEDWMRFCGFSRDELQGQTLRLIQGPETDIATVRSVVEAVAKREPFSATLINYTKHGVRFRHTIRSEPLCNSAGLPIVYKATSRDVSLLLEQSTGSALPEKATSPAPDVSVLEQTGHTLMAADAKYDSAED